ncbi:MAG: ECF transporter S component [Clostridia bacterium]|nr:ECF transporter S component [Clostridia bacterium]
MSKTKKMVFTALICALSFVLTMFVKIPISTVDFLKYDPKDVIIVIAGFIFGPLTTVVVTIIVAFIEMITISSTGPIGFLMNVISTVAFATVAASIYKVNRTMKGAILALVMGIISQTAAMLLWNYAITPLYMPGVTRADLVKMLIPVFLPFNLIKSSVNAALTLIIYKPFVRVMHGIGLIEKESSSKSYLPLLIASVIVIVLCMGAVLILK